MSRSKLSGSGSRRTPRHTWTQDQRRCALLLFTDFELWAFEDAAAAVFHQIFHHEVDPVAFPNGLPCSSLKSQFSEYKQNDNVSWQKIKEPTSRECEARRQEELALKIRSCLDGIDLGESSTARLPRIVASSSSSASRKRKSNALADSYDGRISWADLPPLVVQTRAARHAQMTPAAPPEAFGSSLENLAMEEDEEEYIPRTPCTRRTRTKKPKASPNSLAKTRQYHRPYGPTLSLSEKMFAQAQEGYVPPSEHEVHTPLGGLFFRYARSGRAANSAADNEQILGSRLQQRV